MKKLNIFRLTLTEYFLLTLSAVALACSFENINIDALIWVGLLPFFIVIEKKSAKGSFLAGLYVGLVFYFLTMYWLIATLSTYGAMNIVLCTLIFLLLALYLAAFFGLFAMLHRYTLKRFDSVFIAPLIWVPLEYLRTYLISGFPWILFGYATYRRFGLTQVADITGVYGQSFLILLVNSALYRMYRYFTSEKKKLYKIEAAITCAIFIAALLYGALSLDESIINKNNPIKVGLTQGNIAQELKWSENSRETTMENYTELTQKATEDIQKNSNYDNSPPTLIVWPETAAPFYIQNATNDRAKLIRLAKENNAYILTGALAYEPKYDDPDGEYDYFNSAFLIPPTEDASGEVKLSRYDKVHLVPFGEYVPIHKILFFVDKLTEGIGDFTSGKKAKNLKMVGHNYEFGVLICYESIFPNLVRNFVNNGADFLVNITNDAWFGDTSAPHQQVSMAAFRAVENKRYLIRAANTGISLVIDPFGRVIKNTKLLDRAYLTDEIYTINKDTFYSKYGDVFAVTLSVILLLMLFLAYRKNRIKL